MKDMELSERKKENKMMGFRVRCLDDGSYLVSTENKNYELNKEYSYSDMEEMMKGMKSIMGKMNHKETNPISEKY